MKQKYELRWYNVYEKLPEKCELVYFLWKDDINDVVIGYRTYDSKEEIPHEGWYEVENKTRWTHWWHPLIVPEVSPAIKELMKKEMQKL